MSDPGLPSTLTRQSRRLRRKLARGPIGAACNRLLAGSGARDLILVCDGRVYTSEQQFAPIYRHAARLARQTGLLVRSLPLDVLRSQGQGALADGAIVGLMLPYDMEASEEPALIDQVIRPGQARGQRFILFDGDDDLGVLWRGVLGAVDLCVKKHALADRNAYGRRTIGKSNLTDHVARAFGWSFADNIIPEAGGIGPEAAAKIRIGWNIALDDKIVDLARDMPEPPQGGRSTDILCRASVGPDVWTYPLRNGAVEAIEALKGRFRVHAPTDRVSQAEYYQEMLSSRLSLSPFGFGEICWRDFESILCGCLLMKPDMGHVETSPDLFVPGETYVPVAWDYSDLGEQAAATLADEGRRRAMADEARARLLAQLSADWFMDRFRGQVLGPLDP